MSFIQTTDANLRDFIQARKAEFTTALNVLVTTNTLTPTRTFQAYVRVPNSNYVLALNVPDLWKNETEVSAVVASYDGDVIHGPEKSGGQGKRYSGVFKENAEVNVVIHFHGAYLGAWSNSHRVLPLLYAPAQRHTLARDIPVYIDRRAGESAFINQTIKQSPDTPAILEANGGATFWGQKIIAISQYILILEEGAYIQALAEGLGGSKEFGPGVLEQQWGMGFTKEKSTQSV